MTQKLISDKEAVENLRLLESANTSSRQKWLQGIQDNRDFVLGNQWTAEEVDELKKIGQYPLVINRVYPVIRQKVARLTARDAMFRSIPIDEYADPKMSHVINKLLERIWLACRGSSLNMRAVERAIIDGISFFEVYWDSREDIGRGDVRFRLLKADHVFVDPNATPPLFDDGAYFIINKVLTKEQVLNTYDISEAELDKLPADGDEKEYLASSDYIAIDEPIQPNNMDTDPTRKKYKVIKRYQKIRQKFYVFPDYQNPLSEDEYKELLASVDPDTAMELEENAGIIYQSRIKLVISISTKTVYNNILPIEEYPIIPLININTETPYPISDVTITRDLQREINKRRSLMIAHASATTNPRLFVEEGSVVNEKNLEQHWARPRAVIKIFPGKTPPKPEAPQPLPAALYQLESLAKYDLEYTSGVFALQQGSAVDAPQTYKATMAIEEFGNRGLMMLSRNLSDTLSRLGLVIFQFIQAYYTTNKVIRVFGDTSIESLLVNQESGEEIINNLSVGKYDIQFVTGSTAAMNNWAMLEQLIPLYDRNIIDDVEILKKVQLFDMERLMERKTKLSQAMQQLDSLNKALQDTMQQLESLKKKNMTLEKNLVLEEYKAKLEKELNKLSYAEQKTRLAAEAQKLKAMEGDRNGKQKQS